MIYHLHIKTQIIIHTIKSSKPGLNTFINMFMHRDKKRFNMIVNSIFIIVLITFNNFFNYRLGCSSLLIISVDACRSERNWSYRPTLDLSI